MKRYYLPKWIKTKTQIYPVEKVTWEAIGKFLSNAVEIFFLALLRLQCFSVKGIAYLILSHYIQIS